MTHHAHLGTDRDEDSYPYRMNVKGRRQLFKVLILTLSGFQGFRVAWCKYVTGSLSATAPILPIVTPWYARCSALVVNAALVGLCVWSGRWYLYIVLWVYPILAVGIFLNVLRTIAEHQPNDYPRIDGGSETAMRPLVRTTVPNWFEKWLLYQANFNYHLEHHLFPTVPQHNLGLLHRHLVRHGFYTQFPEALQRSGVERFLRLVRTQPEADYSDAVDDAVYP
jgi:fatty acid desaturase